MSSFERVHSHEVWDEGHSGAALLGVIRGGGREQGFAGLIEEVCHMQGRPPPKANDAFTHISHFPLYFRVWENFHKFSHFWKIYPTLKKIFSFHPSQFMMTPFGHSLRFFQFPYFRKNATFPPVSFNLPVFTCFTCFSFSPYFDNDAFMHHRLLCTYWTPLAICPLHESQGACCVPREIAHSL